MKTCLTRVASSPLRPLALVVLSLTLLGMSQALAIEPPTDSLGVSGRNLIAPDTEQSPGMPIAMPTLKATYLGAGGIVLRDTYLSPLNYGGYNLHFSAETAQYRYRGQGLGGLLLGRGYATDQAGLGASRWLSHHLLSVDYSLTDNPAGNASIHRLQGRWESARLYPLYQGKLGKLMLGGGYTLGVGGLYSTRNGNNPATLKLDGALTLAVSYSQQFTLWGHHLLLRLTSRTDLVGVQWSQQYGENYYELYSVSKAFARRFYLTHLGNQLGQQIRCSLDLPLFRHSMLSLNYRLQYRSWTLNQISNRQTDHTLSLGLVRYLTPVSRSYSPHLLPF